MSIPVPPTVEVMERLYQFALPAAGGASLIVCLFVRLGRRAGSLGSAAAVIVGFLWANFGLPEPKPEWERTADAPFAWESTGRPLPWTPDEDSSHTWHWLPYAALTLVVVGMLSRCLGWLVKRYVPQRQWWVANLSVWLPRLGAVVLVASWLVAERWTERHGTWLVHALGAAMFLQWLILDGIARAEAGGKVAGYLALIFLSASVMFVFHQWPTLAEVAIILGCAMFGVAIAAGATKSDTSGAVPAGVVFLPGLLLTGWEQQDSQIPVAAFWLIGLAPLALTPFLIPRLMRQTCCQIPISQAVLVAIPVAIALVLTVRNQPAPF